MWKSRFELPVIMKTKFEVDIQRLKNEFEDYTANKSWDSLGNEYATLCEEHTRLPKMFFADDEIKDVTSVCDLNWEKASYRQLSLTDYDDSFELSKRVELSNTAWDNRIAKGKKEADERWFRKLKSDIMPYTKQVLQMFPNAHRSRFSLLASGSKVKPHIDYDSTYGIRIHIAISTNEKCVNGGWDKNGNCITEHIPADGSVWFVNPGVKHFAENGGTTDRTHLIISLDSQTIF